MKISTVKLGSICTFQSGGTPSKSIPEYWEGNIPWITTVALNGGYINEKDTGERITETALAKSAAKLVPAQSLMVGTRVGVGKVAINTVPMSTSQDVVSLIGIDEEKWYKPYLSRFLQGKSHDLQSQSRGATIKGIKIETLSELKVPLISLEKQIRISKLLETVETLIFTRKQQLTELATLVKARFVEMFGGIHDSRLYPYISVKGIAEVVSGGTPSREIANYWDNGTIPWVKTTELQNKVITSTEEYITEDGLNNSSAKIVPKGTILIAMYGQGKTRGMTAYLGIEACTNQACACILPTEKINQIYLWQYFVLSYDKLRDMAKGGNQPNLNGNIIKNFPILYPPIRLQNQFSAFVTQVNQTKSVVQKALDEAQTLFDSLMQQYFG